MKIPLLVIFLMSPILSWAATTLEVNGKQYKVHLDEHVKPYMANRVLHYLILVEEKKETDAGNQLAHYVGVESEADIDYAALLPGELSFTADKERKLIRLTFIEKGAELVLFHRMQQMPWREYPQFKLIDFRKTKLDEPAGAGQPDNPPVKL